MQTRNDYIHDLMTSIENMITSLEDREVEDTGFAIARELAEQLFEELEALQE